MTAAPARSSMTLYWVSVAIIIVAFVLSMLDARQMQSADLFATWMAGDFLAMGQADQVYPDAGTRFEMRPPDGWWPHIAETDPEARLFPYIYPPIWAKLVAWLTPLMTFAAFDGAMLIVHQALLILGAALAMGLAGLTGGTRWLAAALTYAALVLTMPIGIALGENQPQIIVSVLIVAAFERERAGSPRLAGALLALAAAIKVYPLLFVVLWAGRRNWSAVVAFAVSGAALGLASIALTGWPLHQEYLSLLATVSRSVIVTNFSLSLDALTAIAFHSDAMVPVQQPNPNTETAGWSAVAKTPLWVMVSGIAQLCGITAMGWLAAKRPNNGLVMPFAAGVFALLSPLSWAYTYLTSLLFLGALPAAAGRLGWAAALAFVLAFHPAIASLTLDLPLSLSGGSVWAFWMLGLSVMVLIVAALGRAALRKPNS